MRLLTQQVKSNISTALPTRIALTFDGCTTPDTHCAGLFATSPENSHYEYNSAFFAFSPSEGENNLNTDEQFTCINIILKIYSNKIK